MTVYKAFVDAAKRADRELVTLRAVVEKRAAKAASSQQAKDRAPKPKRELEPQKR